MKKAGGNLYKYDDLKNTFPKILEECMGMVSKACRKANIGRETYYYWIEKYPEFLEACNAAKEASKDAVEDIIRGKIFNEKDNTMIIFWSKTQMRDRGYGDRPVRTKIALPLIKTIDDVDEATTKLTDLLARGEVTEDDVSPLQSMLMDKRNVIRTVDLANKLIEIQKQFKDILKHEGGI